MSEIYRYRGYEDSEEAFNNQQELNSEMRLQLRAQIMEMVTRHHDEAWHLRHSRREQILKGNQQ